MLAREAGRKFYKDTIMTTGERDRRSGQKVARKGAKAQ
jgi:hypothetical protein